MCHSEHALCKELELWTPEEHITVPYFQTRNPLTEKLPPDRELSDEMSEVDAVTRPKRDGVERGPLESTRSLTTLETGPWYHLGS